MITPAKTFLTNLCELHFSRSGRSRVNKGFIQMINALRRTPALWALMSIILFAAATPAHSQAPTAARRRGACGAQSGNSTSTSRVSPGRRNSQA
jgi:hypothetical protein